MGGYSATTTLTWLVLLAVAVPTPQAAWFSSDGDPDAGVVDEETGETWYVVPGPLPDLPAQNDDGEGEDTETERGHGEALDPPCRLIFSINSGRTGSGYLARLLSLDRWVDAGHERSPSMFGNVLQRAKREGLEATYETRRRLKIPYMRRIAKRCAGSTNDEGVCMQTPQNGGWRIYAETSHAFIKTFWDVVMDEFLGDPIEEGDGADDDDDAASEERDRCRIDVVVLRRPMADVACSLYRRNWTRIHDDWLIEPWSALATLPDLRLRGWANRHTQEMGAVLWYLHDTEAKYRQFRERYGSHPDVHLHEVQLRHLQTAEGVDELFARMDLRRGRGTAQDRALDTWYRSNGQLVSLPPDRSDQVIGRAHNANHPSLESGTPCPRWLLKDRLQQLWAAAERQGVELPYLPL